MGKFNMDSPTIASYPSHPVFGIVCWMLVEDLFKACLILVMWCMSFAMASLEWNYTVQLTLVLYSYCLVCIISLSLLDPSLGSTGWKYFQEVVWERSRLKDYLPMPASGEGGTGNGKIKMVSEGRKEGASEWGWKGMSEWGREGGRKCWLTVKYAVSRVQYM